MKEVTTTAVSEEVKQWYWKKVQMITIISFIAWLIVAIVLPASAPSFKGVAIGSLPPLHWYIPAFISIVLGIAIIFIYALVMNKLDEELRRRVRI
ncbi:putative solute:sodium symporter small subunit [Pyrobaculum oguniense TE7]|uniref:Solute:sodium symporter small subunit n=1 Tax=Pyrobaculum oguniense (strain DSM 13380 / JCM 10595 / TE7) TaxID=698757 RepID=H6QAG2_PYROT|nr:putative solute:sodium symporter small subunit [Pyrobaculum oguniense TE7]